MAQVKQAGAEPGQALLGDALLGGQPAKQAGQLDALGPGQRGADLVLVAAAGGLYLAQHVTSLRGQVQRVGAPVGGVATAFDQAALLELVDQEHHPGGVEPDELAQGLLRQPLVGGQPEKHSGVPRLQAERREPFAELPGQVRSQLHQQEGEVTGIALVFVHLGRLSPEEYSCDT
jgi:hypothetical protein